MKHYEIKKGKNGWTTATVIRKDGSKESYNCFYNKDEALKWCYAKVRYDYGKAIANAEI